MEERLRRQYLDAMGIQNWMPRDAVVPEEVISESVPQVAVTEPPRQTEVVVSPNGDVAALDWDGVEARVASCSACELHQTRTQSVFGVGDRSADLLVIGEAPGADEDRQGEPFVGRAGQLLNAMLQAIGLKREQVFIANILKCRPPGNRDPRPEEVLQCEPYLLRQIELLQPKLILAVGRIAAQNLLHSHEAVGKMRGREHQFGDSAIPLIVTYHPAYLLRSPDQKGKAWQDLQMVVRVLQRDS
jgi:DNA polymerase